MEYENLLDSIQQEKQLDRAALEKLTKTTLHVLSEQLPKPDIAELISELPEQLSRRLDDTARMQRRHLTLHEFCDRVAELSGIPADETRKYVNIAFYVLDHACASGGMRRVMDHLPAEYEGLLSRP